MRRTDWLEHADRVSRVVGELACAQSHSQGSYGIGVPPAVQLATCYSPCLLVHSFARSFARVQFNLIDEVAAGNVEAGVYWAEKQLWLEEPEPLLSYADCRFNVRARSRSRTRALLHCVAHYCPGTHTQELQFKFKPISVCVRFNQQSIDLAADDNDTMLKLLEAACHKIAIPQDTVSTYALFLDHLADVRTLASSSCADRSSLTRSPRSRRRIPSQRKASWTIPQRYMMCAPANRYAVASLSLSLSYLPCTLLVLTRMLRSSNWCFASVAAQTG